MTLNVPCGACESSARDQGGRFRSNGRLSGSAPAVSLLARMTPGIRELRWFRTSAYCFGSLMVMLFSGSSAGLSVLPRFSAIWLLTCLSRSRLLELVTMFRDIAF